MYEIQKQLAELGVDGWLLYDFAGSNPLARAFLNIDADKHLTRRFFYWIPQRGEPCKLVHQIEPHVLDHLPGEKKTYLRWQELEKALQLLLVSASVVAMEYSMRIPTVSTVDGGVIDLIRSFGPKVVSSALLLQRSTSVWDETQYKMHVEAAEFLDKTAAATWSYIKTALSEGTSCTEYDVQQFILLSILQAGFLIEGAPICAVNSHAADPHFSPDRFLSTPIKKGDVVLIDLWCKKDAPRAVYADITRMALVHTTPSEKQQEVFDTVRRAQRQATEFVAERVRQGEDVLGWEVDAVCRAVIDQAGYGPFFIHRTGHNIHTTDHGPGANLDSLETYDDRPLLPSTCFSIEPGIYLPGAFGVRLEYDIYITPHRTTLITGGTQDHWEII